MIPVPVCGGVDGGASFPTGPDHLLQTESLTQQTPRHLKTTPITYAHVPHTGTEPGGHYLHLAITCITDKCVQALLVRTDKTSDMSHLYTGAAGPDSLDTFLKLVSAQ